MTLKGLMGVEVSAVSLYIRSLICCSVPKGQTKGVTMKDNEDFPEKVFFHLYKITFIYLSIHFQKSMRFSEEGKQCWVAFFFKV